MTQENKEIWMCEHGRPTEQICPHCSGINRTTEGVGFFETPNISGNAKGKIIWPLEKKPAPTLDNELWVGIPNCRGRYFVSNIGRVKSLNACRNTREIILNPQKLRGYPSVYIYSANCKGRWHSVHRLVAAAFLPKEKGKAFVNHKNGIKTDNSVANLEWCTTSHNVKHSYDMGLHIHARGEKWHSSKLKDIEVKQIGLLLGRGVGQEEIAQRFGVTSQAISKINVNKRWIKI